MASTPRPSRSGSDTRTSAPPTASISTPTWRSRRPRSPRPRHRAPAQAGTGPPTRCSPSWKACEYAALTNTQPAAAQPLADLAPHIRARRIRGRGRLRGAVGAAGRGPGQVLPVRVPDVVFRQGGPPGVGDLRAGSLPGRPRARVHGPGRHPGGADPVRQPDPGRDQGAAEGPGEDREPAVDGV